MEQRDYILREIEKISVMLLGMLGKYKRIMSEKQFEQERAMIDNELKEAGELSIDKLLSFTEEEIISFIDQNKGFDQGNMELLADLLIAFAKNLHENESINLIKKAVLILEHIDSKTKTFSLERSLKINCLKEKLNLD
ncbi:MAG: hypothetical protein JW965_07715 [Bacteroidales bacterium]|nr:hypothetical protein [Bacteroidales bacterium]